MSSLAKSRLFEYCSQHQLTAPKFTAWQNQNNKWLATVSCFDKKFDSTTEYSRKKDAENNVAKLALDSLSVETKQKSKDEDLYEVSDDEDDETKQEPSKQKEADSKSNESDEEEEEESSEYDTEEVEEDLKLILEYINNKGILQRTESFYTWIPPNCEEESCKIEYSVKKLHLDGEVHDLRHLKISSPKFADWNFCSDFDSILPPCAEFYASYVGENTFDSMFRVRKLGLYILITLSCE